MPYQRQILLSRDPVPRPSVVLLSALAHLLVLALIVVALRQAAGIHIVPAKYETVQAISGKVYLSSSEAGAKVARPRARRSRLQLSKRRVRVPDGNAAEGAAVLRRHAQQATAGMMASLRFLHTYGFSSDHYELAFQTAGQLPTISAAELPPRFEQYVTVEVTIDIDGHVADARVVGGEVDPAIEQRLLAAVREFKYSPAKRDGAPIPSQVDLVVHIPS
jgi:TonB family protein